MKKNAKTEKTVLWAVDPGETETRPSRANLEQLFAWTSSLGWKVQPITVLAPSKGELQRGNVGSLDTAQAALADYLGAYEQFEFLEGKVLVADTTTGESPAERFLKFGKECGAGAVAVSSHGRSGLERLILGSFAEKVLERSPWPVFFLNHQGAKSARSRVVLFPTNFSEESRNVYRELLRMLSGGSQELVLYHGVAYPMPPASGAAVYVPEDFVKDQELWAKSEGAKWAEEAEKAGIRAKAQVKVGGVGSVNGSSILQAAKDSGATTMVISATSSLLGRILLGSPAYEVFRANQALSLVFGPGAVAALAQSQPERASGSHVSP